MVAAEGNEGVPRRGLRPLLIGPHTPAEAAVASAALATQPRITERLQRLFEDGAPGPAANGGCLGPAPGDGEPEAAAGGEGGPARVVDLAGAAQPVDRDPRCPVHLPDGQVRERLEGASAPGAVPAHLAHPRRQARDLILAEPEGAALEEGPASLRGVEAGQRPAAGHPLPDALRDEAQPPQALDIHALGQAERCPIDARQRVEAHLAGIWEGRAQQEGRLLRRGEGGAPDARRPVALQRGRHQGREERVGRDHGQRLLQPDALGADVQPRLELQVIAGHSGHGASPSQASSRRLISASSASICPSNAPRPASGAGVSHSGSCP